MYSNKVKNILLNNRNVGSVICQDNGIYQDKNYEGVVFCDMIVAGCRYPIAIGIGDNWERELFDFFVRDPDSFPFIPHIDTSGKICLFDLEGALIDYQFEGLLNQCVYQAYTIIDDGISGRNKKDFIREFDAYWTQLPSGIVAKFDAPVSRKSNLLKYVYPLPDRKTYKNLLDYERKKRTAILYAGTSESKMFQIWKVTGTQKNGLYVSLDLLKYVYPPDPRVPLSVDYVNEILELINKDDIKHAVGKTKNTVLLIFDLLQPDGSRIIIGIYSDNTKLIEMEKIFQLPQDAVLHPVYISRIDIRYLQNRTSETANPLAGKKILLLGCGSVGGYVGSFLAKAGCNDLTLIDDQMLHEENIFRHVLSMGFIGQYKSVAMSQFLKSDVPGIDARSTEGKIEDLVLEGSIDFREYDIIISATGNHNVNRWINRFILEESINIPVIYGWNEPLDIGCHAAIIDYSIGGNYESLFSRDENGVLFDRSAYCSPYQEITRSVYGCGSSFIPYGTEVSIQTAIMTIDLVKRLVSGEINNSFLLSLKGAGYYFHRAGMKHTDRYEQQIKQFVEERFLDP